ncbi:MAG: 4-(cytidine 5'-diphospho)-2-C-methyl-D-erythritol kinase [Pirellulales bacterium]|nr:4-(cytidine 5'-diphospho)-2-C-methyl-D-erythritol kinase [Pirellulales bacterium]
MLIHRSAVEVVVHTPAKLNLFFEVLAKRDDGYHEIETLICPINLFDTVCFRAASNGRVDFQCVLSRGFGVSDNAEPGAIPEGCDNIAVRAVELLRRRAGLRAGARLRLVKRIPAAAGLGGGSSDAAAALSAANIGWKLDWPSEELARLAAELGSDVPFFLAKGAAICRGRGERIQPLQSMGELHFAVVRPPEGLATPAVYGQCLPAENAKSAAPLIAAFERGDVGKAGRLLFNRLEPAATRLSSWIARLRRIFRQSDCLGHGMSGSGSAYFGLCRHALHARRLARRLESLGVGCVFAVRSCS